MHKTHLPICTWLIASYLLATGCKGISSLKLASLLGLQYRTTWHLTRRIRAMMGGNPDLLRGIVELDETFIGGRPRRRNKPGAPAPMPLFDEPEPKPEPERGDRRRRGRGGGKPMALPPSSGVDDRLTPLASHGIGNIAPIVRRWLDRAATTATDELPAYLAVGRALAGHIRVNHSALAGIDEAGRVLARRIMRQALKPDVPHLSPRLDVRVASVASSRKADHADLWASLRLPGRGRLDIPLHPHRHFLDWRQALFDRATLHRGGRHNRDPAGLRHHRAGRGKSRGL